MQRIGADRRRRIISIINLVLPFVVLGLTVVFDQLTKSYFKSAYPNGEISFVIPNFFYFTYTVNPGAAWSFLAGVEWAQTFFKIISVVAFIGFGIFMYYALKKKYKWLSYSVAFMIGGTLGNFIDRVSFNGVTDFIGFIFGNYHFPIFNLADSFLVVGVIMFIIHCLFIDKEGLFNKMKKEEKKNNGNGDEKV